MKFSILLVVAATCVSLVAASVKNQPYSHRLLGKKEGPVATVEPAFNVYDHCQGPEEEWRCPTEGNPNKVKICHYNNGNGYKQICVDDSAADAHLGKTHNADAPDYCGVCSPADLPEANTKGGDTEEGGEASTKSSKGEEESTKSVKSEKKESSKSVKETTNPFDLSAHCTDPHESKWRCPSDDNPNKLLVCHWDNDKGYETLCIDDADASTYFSKTQKSPTESSKKSVKTATAESEKGDSDKSSKNEESDKSAKKETKKNSRRRLGSEKSSKKDEEKSSKKEGSEKKSKDGSSNKGSDKSLKSTKTKEDDDEPLMPDLCGPCTEPQLQLDPLAIKKAKLGQDTEALPEETEAPPEETESPPEDTEVPPEETEKTVPPEETEKTPKNVKVDPMDLINQHCAGVKDWNCGTNGNEDKVKICHWNNGNGWNEICVAASAVDAHLGKTHNAKNGKGGHAEPDYCGPCGGPTTTTTGGLVKTGGSYGDPHIKTWQGKIFDFHGECDLVLAHSQQFANGKGLDIHIRTEISHDWSFISGVAMRIGDETLEVAAHGLHYLNGVKGAVTAAKSSGLRGHSSHTIAGFPISFSQHMKIEQRYEIDLGAEGKILIKAIDKFLAVNIQDATGKDFIDSVGLMGEFTTGNKLGRDGHVIEDDNTFGLEWQVRDAEPKLFREGKGPQWPRVCRLPEQTAGGRRRRLDESAVSYVDAIKACEHWPEADRDTCIYDVLSTGELALAQSGVF